MQSVDWVKIAPEVAKQLLGEPKSISSTEMRWGTHGSMVLNLEKGTFYTFEGGFGGGVVDLIKYLNEDVTTVLKQFGYDQALSSDSLLSVSVTPPNGINKGNARSFDRKQMGTLLKQAVVALQYANDFWVMRFPDGHHIKQKYAPFIKNIDGSWSMKRPEGDMPIYFKNTEEHKDKPIVICEGEKALLGAEKIYEGDCVTWHGGVNSWEKADWSPIYGREIIIWPDNDDAGKKCALAIKKHLRKNKCKVKVVTPPESFNDKDDLWDAAERLDFNEDITFESFISKSPRLGARFTRADALLEQVDNPDWLIKDVVEKESLMCIFGAPKSGKSFIAIDMAASIAGAKSFYGNEANGQPVMYVCGEGQRGVKRRLKALDQDKYKVLAGIPLYLSDKAFRINDTDDFDALEEEIEEVILEAGNIGMIVIDTFQRNFSGNENSAEDVGNFINKLDMLISKYKCCVCLVHHTGHGNASRGRGSSVMGASLDYEFKVERDDQHIAGFVDEQMLVSFEQTLNKDGQGMAKKSLIFHEVQIKGEGLNLTSGYLKETEHQIEKKAKSIGFARKIVLDALEREAYIKNKNAPDEEWFWAKDLTVKDENGENKKTDTIGKSLIWLKDNKYAKYNPELGYQSAEFSKLEPNFPKEV
jgi:5S rRNA maturation endonuclease (ribonuclease M5)/KaiC/GvpD/RAD55 family RecA-like ATPase